MKSLEQLKESGFTAREKKGTGREVFEEGVWADLGTPTKENMNELREKAAFWLRGDVARKEKNLKLGKRGGGFCFFQKNHRGIRNVGGTSIENRLVSSKPRGQRKLVSPLQKASTLEICGRKKDSKGRALLFDKSKKKGGAQKLFNEVAKKQDGKSDRAKKGCMMSNEA